MKAVKDIDELHTILLNIGKQFHKICVKNSIPYYMLGGTMLGAVRHCGFIPWDDDMDFGIPRIYLDAFLDACRCELPSYYSVIGPDDKEYGIVMGTYKILDNRTVMIEHGNENAPKQMGVFIDVFILDYSDNEWYFLSRNYLIRQFLFWNSFGYRKYRKKKLKHKLISLIVNLLPEDFFRKTAIWLIKRNGEYYSNYCGFWGKRETIHKTVFGFPILYKFEDTLFYGVSDYDSYLTRLYSDYMQLPPEDKRHIHIENVYIKTLAL